MVHNLTAHTNQARHSLSCAVSTALTLYVWCVSCVVCRVSCVDVQVNLVKLMPDLAGSVADSTTLLSASDDNTIGQWDVERGVCVRTFDGIGSLISHPHMPTRTAPHTYRACSPKLTVQPFSGHTGWVLALDCDANRIVSAGSCQPINIWDARSGFERSIPCGRYVLPPPGGGRSCLVWSGLVSTHPLTDSGVQRRAVSTV
jgi:WD40 repeat protein